MKFMLILSSVLTLNALVVSEQSEQDRISIALLNGLESDESFDSAENETDSDWERTVIFFYRHTNVGQDLFIRGGIDHTRRSGCSFRAASSPCSIPIQHNGDQTGSHFAKYNAWKEGDTVLDWYGGEFGQGSYQGRAALGTPTIWTTNQRGQAGYNPLNKYGSHYWFLDINMNCTRTSDDEGWFEVKGFFGTRWENTISTYRGSMCRGDEGGPVPAASANHWVKCGKINVIRWNSNTCNIYDF